MNKKEILELIYFFEIEFQKYGIECISLESYEILFYYASLYNK